MNGSLAAGSLPATAGCKERRALSVRLFVGNLPYDTTEAELHAYFATTGAPTRIAIPLDRVTGRPRGFAFVDFADADVAKAVIRKFDSQPFKTRPLAVREARPRTERPPGSRPPGPRPPGGRPMGGRPGGGLSHDGAGRGGFDSPGGGDQPRRQRGGPARRTKAERGGPKGPIPIRTTGRFFADEDDDDAPDVELDFDNFATRAPSEEDSEHEGDDE